MSQPAVVLVELDGAIGTLPTGVNALAIIATATAGPIATPATFAQRKDVISNFTGGQLVESAGYWIENKKRPALLTRATTATPGTNGSVTHTGAGTSVVTASGAPTDEFEIQLDFLTAGTIGVAGITFTYSLDGGRTKSPVIALGIANSYLIPGSGATANFAAGTVLANQREAWSTVAPAFDAAGLGAAITALAASNIAWDVLYIAGPMTAALFDVVETAFGSLPDKCWIGEFRKPTSGESEATYKTAFDTAFSAKATTKGGVCAGGAWVTSGIGYQKFFRPIGIPAACHIAFLSEEEDGAQIDLGSLPGVSIRDTNGNPLHHDESVNPGLDDSRAITLRTWGSDVQGVYINNPRLLSAAGSDFEFIQHRRVMNIAKRALRLYFQRRLSKKIVVDKLTGFIKETEAREIESGANAVLRAVLLQKPKASASLVTISRTDNLLSTKTLTVQATVTPLAYPKLINLNIGFRNPALQTVAV
jgi:hypothetical protein